MKLFQYISCYSLSYVNKKDKSIIQMFQYISCYSLSNYTENIMEDKASFNTSHVTLYPSRLLSVQCRRVFQYISCYSLSKEGIDNMKDVRSFNTSHVTLYPSFYRLFFF